MTSRNAIKKKLLSVCSEQTLKEMISYVENDPPSLWGMEKPPKFIGDMVILTLWKDLTGKGFRAIEEEINFRYPITHSSLEHNVPLVRKKLRQWSIQYINSGDKKQWKNAAGKANLPEGPLSDTTIWADSTDFPIVGTKSTKKSGDSWSYKLNGRGRRYVMFIDALGTILSIWGGHSPKLHDSEFLSCNQDEIESKFARAVVIGDSHFSKGRKIFQNVKFHVNITKTTLGKRKRDDKDDDKEKSKLTAEDNAYNKQHSKIRSRVELTFGKFKLKWKSLSEPWTESEYCLDDCVRVVAALYNIKVKH